jgi:polyisoprenoid-binding protein YceI
MSATTTTTAWTFDTAHSHVGFAVRHMMITTVKGQFTALAGEVHLDADDLAGSRVRVEIDTASIDTRNDQRDAHLRSADFFDVESHPKMLFESRSIRPAGDGRWQLEGDLTIRGTTRPVVFEVEEEGQGIDPWGGERRGFSARTKIDRRDFGLTWNQAIETGGVLVADQVQISIDAQLVRAQ